MSKFPKVAVLTLLSLFGSSLLSSSPIPSALPASISLREKASDLYSSINFADAERPEFDMFSKAMEGYDRLKEADKLTDPEIITLIDFRKSGNEKRLWVIGLKSKKVLQYSLVAHGRNSGEVYARVFSNKPNSNKSSLGFYVTGGTYIGKHGLSLKLHGVEKGINDLAEARAIVMHGADYVSESFIKKVGRLGRSLGCPAVPMENYKEIITQIAGGTCLFIYYPDQEYLKNTKMYNPAPLETTLARGDS
ncbi:MAG: murein L,D-transpeptidase catalytic domain family protein [Cyclobacteriaceae bacterium]|nr:murein L,D-transpeptidase catalytic domain family protein [Cyclobacteriaceae bacterium]MDH4297426.1 murein L,D-transpeptidase catalytic domain family protein [Cyclobacteriaceae bacterium]MDH5247861.1 murein L,D-transpeptidase catalytic domain family protein [Cyclobacteriaceae bacterium]